MNSLFVELLNGSPVALRAQLVDAARSTLTQGKTTLVVALDAVRSLDDAALASLVVALRTLRAAGGTIRLVATREDLRERLALTGLTNVFEVFVSREDAEGADGVEPPGSARSRVRMALGAVSSAVVLLIALLGLPASTSASDGASTAPSDPAALAVLARLIERNPSLRTYEADMRVDVKMLSFPFLRPTLTGKTYYKRPDNYEVVFDRVPSFARGLEHLYADIGDPSTWDRRFVVTLDGARTVNGRRELALRMVQRVRGMIEHEEVYVDEPSATISELQYHYYNGGVISLRQGFTMVNGYAVVTSQLASIKIPHVRAVATASYSDIRTNVAIDDTVFAKNRQAQQ